MTALAYDMRRKTVAGREYLYEIHDRGGNGTSLGRWSDELGKHFAAYHKTKSDAKARREATAAVLAETCRLYRALRLPLLASPAGAILREADRRGLLGKSIMLVGTNVLPAYAVEAGAFLDAPDETYDFDMAWSGNAQASGQPEVWPMLKAVDATYTINGEKPFQARNAAAYEVELLAAPSRMSSMARRDQPRPVERPEQEWLLEGTPVDRIVATRDNLPARIVAPDPRWFALQKLWLSERDQRNPLKRPKDLKQGLALLDAVHLAMPHYPLDDIFETSLPDELAPLYRRWHARRPERPPAVW